MTRTMYELTPQETITRVRVLIGEDADPQRRGGKKVELRTLQDAHVYTMRQAARLFRGDFGEVHDVVELIRKQEPLEVMEGVAALVKVIGARFPTLDAAAAWCEKLAFEAES